MTNDQNGAKPLKVDRERRWFQKETSCLDIIYISNKNKILILNLYFDDSYGIIFKVWWFFKLAVNSYNDMKNFENLNKLYTNYSFVTIIDYLNRDNSLLARIPQLISGLNCLM